MTDIEKTDGSTEGKCRDCGVNGVNVDEHPACGVPELYNCEYCGGLICYDCIFTDDDYYCKYCCYSEGLSVAVAEELKSFFEVSKTYLDDPDTDNNHKFFLMSALLESTEIAIQQANDIHKSGYPETKEN